jgi:hypothetical protein
MVHVGDLIRFRKGLVHRENITVLRVARITSTLPVFTRGRCSQLFPDRFRWFEKADGVVQRLEHLCLSIQPQNLGSR